jgi:hypothetical protein
MTPQPKRTIVFTLPPKRPWKKPTRNRVGRLPRVARLMALAIRFEDLLQTGAVKDFADLSRLGRVTRARISQIMNLLNLAPDLQERVLFLTPVLAKQDEISERILRAVVDQPCWAQQRRLFAEIESQKSILLCVREPIDS